MRYLMEVSILIGSTGYVGSYLLENMVFEKFAHKSDISSLANIATDVLICAGMPATKWLANENPEEDFTNMNCLWDVVQTICAESPILISTIDVYSDPIAVDENTPACLSGLEAYGTNRAILESRFLRKFPHGHVIRLPGLFSRGLRKNLIFDLINSRAEQFMKVNADSLFQFFNLEDLPGVIKFVLYEKIPILNVSSEPIQAQEVADIFDRKLSPTGPLVQYDMQTIYGKKFGVEGRYLFRKESVLRDIRFWK